MRYLALSDLEEALRHADLVVVGAGLTGLTIAERTANKLSKNVVVLDKRDHPGGNAWSTPDEETGIEVHHYGTHIFHTSNQRVWEYVNRFAKFNSYQHTVWANHRGVRYPMPINLQTMSLLAGASMAPWQAREWVAANRVTRPNQAPANLVEQAIDLVGAKAYYALIHGYTTKQWGVDPHQLPASIIRRLPVRYDLNQRYFNDTWEGLPVMGYGALVENLGDFRGIQISLGVDWNEVRHLLEHRALGESPIPVVFTGPIDDFFGHRFGRLGWRTVDLEVERLDQRDYQGAAVINEADADVPYTRIHEFRHLHPERDRPTPGGLAHHPEKTIVAREYSRFAHHGDEPYYPVNAAADRDKLKWYRQAAAELENVLFAGRLGTYKYLDMHMAVASALSLFDNAIEPHLLGGLPLKRRGERDGTIAEAEC